MAVGTAQRKEAGRAPLPLSSRNDTWWVRPLLTVIVLGGFVLYSTWRALENQYYRSGRLPVVPLLASLARADWSLFGWNISPAIYILIFPAQLPPELLLLSRGSTARTWDPLGCAVQRTRRRVSSTPASALPVRAQNFHRFAFYAAVVFIVLLGIRSGVLLPTARFGVGVGSLGLSRQHHPARASTRSPATRGGT